MRKETQHLIENSPLKYPDGSNHVKIISGDFIIEDYKIVLKHINLLSVNSVDIYDLEDEGIVNDDLVLFFKEALPEKDEIDSIGYDESNMELHINHTSYHLVDYDEFGYFVGDFNGKVKETVNSVMKAFVRWATM